MTPRVYLDDPYCRACEAAVVASADGASVLSRTVFHPGGGGQPHDRGALVVVGEALAVTSVREDERGQIWHHVGRELAVGDAATPTIEWPFRYALMRHHALLHVVNTIALREFGARMTGTQLGPERSRIDFDFAGSGFARERVADFEAKVNAVLAAELPIAGSVITEADYRARPELVRTRDVAPPVVDGAVRIVTIGDWDAQACGGTHVHSTREIGAARIVKFDNKGRDNKRLYWELAPAAEPTSPP
nr:alanyl-tRNA editing protein [Kofleriaceae bacterium]